MRASRLALLMCALALAACAADPPKKAARKPAPPAKTAQAKPAETRPAPKTEPRATPSQTPPAGKPATTPTPAPTRPTEAAPRPAEPAPSAATPPPAPASPQERYAEALQLLKTGQLQAAEAALVRATKDFPQQTGPQTNLGIVLARLNRKNEAAAAFAKAIALDPKNAVAHNWLGVLARERGEYARAEQSYQQALAADASHAPAQLNLAILYDLYLKRPADAVAAYRRYEQMMGSKDARAAVWIAELQAQLGAAAPKAVPVGTPKPAAPPPRKTGANS